MGLYLAHLDTRREKVSGMGLAFGSVSISEVRHLLDLLGVTDTDHRYRLLRYWEAMDAEFVPWINQEVNKKDKEK